MEICGRDGRSSRRGSNKRMECKGRPKWRAAPLTQKAHTSAVLDRRCARRRWKYAVGTEEARGAGRTKEWNAKDDQNGRDAPLTKKAPSRMPELGPYGSVR